MAALASALCFAAGACAQQQGYKLEGEAGSSFERLTQGLGDWRSTYLDLEGRNETRQSYYGRLRTTERFGRDDGEATVGTYQPFAGVWAMQLEAVASPTHHVLAKHSLLAQIERRFEGGWIVQGGLRRSAFDHADTDLVIATVGRYFSRFRAAYSLYLGRPEGAGFSPSHRLQGNYFYGDRSFVGVAGYVGREVENVFPFGVSANEVRGASVAGRHEFAPNWALAYEVLTHRQGDLYTRRGFSVGIRHAF